MSVDARIREGLTMIDKQLPEIDAVEGRQQLERKVSRHARRRRVIIAAAAAVVLVGTAGVVLHQTDRTSPKPAQTPRRGVTSSLDGRTSLPHRIHWTATPSRLGRIKEVEFLIDGHKDWVEYHPPYFYGTDHSYLVTSFLQPGEHTFTVKAIPVHGHSASNSVTATVPPTSSPPAALQGTWKAAHEFTTLVVSSEGWHMDGGPWADVAYPASGIAQVKSWMAAGQKNSDAPTWDGSYLFGYMCHNRQGGPAGSKLWSSRDESRYRWTVTGRHLQLTLVGGHPCQGLKQFLASSWTKAR
jgi:hypothetical protein